MKAGLLPRLLLVGRNADRLAAVARSHKLAHWTTDLAAALADRLPDRLRCGGDAAACRGAGKGDRRR